MNKIQTKFLVAVAGFTILFSMFVIGNGWRSGVRQFEEVVDQQARLALEFDLGIREYVAQTIRPFAENQVEKDDFVPEVMSTSFVARNVFEKVQKKFPDYIIKFSSDDARNPANQASPEELAVIKRFNENPDLKRWEGQLQIDGNAYYAHFSARRMKSSCLRCHGDVKDAPSSLVQLYGDKAGFHRPIGQVIALDTVAIPIDKYRAAMWTRAACDVLFILVGLALLFLGISFVFKRIVTRRLSMISEYFRKIAKQDNLGSIQLIKSQAEDEIGELEKSFNSLVERLCSVYESHEEVVNQKTAHLQSVNQQLEFEIEARTKTEKELEKSELRHQLYIEQTPLAVIEWDVDFLVMSWNPAAETIFGYSAQEAIGRQYKELIGTEASVEHVKIVCRHLLENKGSLRTTNVNIRKDGTEIECEWYNTPLVDEQGKVVAITSTVQDISSRRRRQRQLKAAKQQADDANRAKSEFLANMSHEIRTPMNSIIGFGNLLADEELTPDQQDYLATIQDSATNLLNIINDILDLSKMEAGKLDIQMETIAMEDFLESIHAMFKFQAERKKIDFAIHRCASLPEQITSDPTRLRQCLVNLISNAVKFTGTGHVYLNLCLEEIDNKAFIRFDVEDTGIGISANKQQHIFEAFTQADGSTTRKYGGTGLGLTITLQLARLLGGDVSVSSQSGKGSVFSLTIPVEGKRCQRPSRAVNTTRH